MKERKIYPQCNFLDDKEKRCKKRSALQLSLHLDSELYELPAWLKVNLCPEHYIHFGGTFLKQKDKQ